MTSQQNRTFTEKVVKSALLHDIGKLIQRAEYTPEGSSRERHEIVGAKYLGNYQIDEDVVQAVKRHHDREFYKGLENFTEEQNRIAAIVNDADSLAAASERRKAEQDDKGWDSEANLKSIFSFNKITPEKYRDCYYETEILQTKIKNPDATESGADLEKYKEIYKKFDEHFKAGKYGNNDISINSLLEILEETTSYITSDTYLGNNADISLYEHSKMTACFAGCLCFSDKFLLVSGDISGIQDFIYTSGALKSLRGRSFYLDFILEHIATEILLELGLNRTNLLYTGGGHFYLLIYDNEKAKEFLKEAKTKINDWFIEQFNIKLYLAMGWQEVSENELKNDVSNIYKKVSERLSKDKMTRYDKEQLKSLLEVKDNSDFKTCAVCGKSIKDCVANEKLSSDGVVCKLCDALYKAGESLVKETKDPYICVVNNGGSGDLELPSLDENTKHLRFYKEKNATHVIQYYTTEFRKGETDVIRLMVADYKKRDTTDFEDLLKDGKGIKRLGCLRADVDNLGTIFKNSFKNSKGEIIYKYNDKYDNNREKEASYNTFTRSAVLSKQFSLFFKHYIKDVCRDKKLAVVYSGGDDVFVVGEWWDTFNFTRDLYKNFREYTNNTCTFSAGLGFYGSNFPIHLMASMTGAMETKAKKNDKNSLCMFGTDYEYGVYHWNELEDKVMPKFNILNDEKLGMGFIYKIRSLIVDKKNEKINLARLAYTIGRANCDKRISEELKKNIYDWCMDASERKAFVTAIDIFVYYNRNEGGKNA